MKSVCMGILGSLALCLVLTFAGACSGDHRTSGEGSEPINGVEAIEYQKALLRCYKTGGTRIVKIAGQLRCY